MQKPNRPTSLVDWLSDRYNTVFSDNAVGRVELFIINMALVGFVLHLLLIFLAKHALLGPYFSPQIPSSYLQTIYTPFSIFLFYEVLTLVLILPKSIASFIGKQFEIMTLITIRSFFHDIADYDLDKPDLYTIEFLGDIGLDLFGSLLLFFLTIVYYRLFARTRRVATTDAAETHAKRNQFIQVKKAAAFLLCLLLLVQSVISLVGWSVELFGAIQAGGHLPNPNAVFYKEFFSVMIFVDVFLLIFSFIYANSYDVLFRNAGFVISTILVRISLTAQKPFTVYFALTAVLFGVLLMALSIFYNQKTATKPTVTVADEGV
ncbi:hypothetical protein [Fibrella aquatilis]|uniref:Uncharacterized protein n=1 Tax=Fibrella aquatilis TaxID=2817059 RepID=A0A939K194_9BACT|nr:hypothetical protein [Fibrella aquatilis]MBO0933278.1 hypothetical protein [Fibrella aquatilis]